MAETKTMIRTSVFIDKAVRDGLRTLARRESHVRNTDITWCKILNDICKDHLKKAETRLVTK
jgi:hypothetical protein